MSTEYRSLPGRETPIENRATTPESLPTGAVSQELLEYIERCLEVIRARYPDVEKRAAAVAHWSTPDHFFVKLEDEWFKFPRYDEADGTLDTQTKLLPQLAKKLPVAVPEFKYWGTDGEHWQDRFVGYRKIKGYSLGDRLESETLLSVRIAKGLGGLISAVHRFSTKAAEEAGVPVVTGEEIYAELLSIYQAAVSIPRLVQDGLHRRSVEAFFQAGLGDEEVFMFTPRLVHGNVVSDVLVDDKLKPCGLTGWGNAVVGDPAAEFGWIMWKCEEDLIDHLMEGYEAAEDPETLWRRIMFYWGLAYMFEAMDAASKNEDGMMVFCLDFLREGFARRAARVPRMGKKSLLSGVMRLGR
jgi:aminoglycoside phosphotransferase (APT) family kinase protein